MYEEFNVKRHYQTKHVNAYDKLSGSDRADKMNQSEAFLAQQRRFLAQICESNENTTKASYKVAMLIAKYGKPLNFYG